MKKFLLYSIFALIGLTAISILFFAIRQMVVNAQIKREEQIIPAAVPHIETTTRLEIIPLYEEASLDEASTSGTAFLILSEPIRPPF